MSWGGYWMFYVCPKCKEKFRYELGYLDKKDFGKCPKCKGIGDLVGESNKNLQEKYLDYPEIY